MTHDEMIAVIQAHKEGKPIEYRSNRDPDARWDLCHYPPTWQFLYNSYRVKAEPRILYLNEYPNGSFFAYRDIRVAANSNEEEGSVVNGAKLVRYQEILE